MSDQSSATERVGRYQILDTIGVGPNGTVARAKVFGVAGFERQFAVKKFLPELTQQSAQAQALSAAARAYGSLEHPRIARMSEFGVAQGTTFTAVEHVAGLDALRLLTETKVAGVALAIGGALALVSQAARAVGYAHGRGLVHLGLSPTNVIVTAEGDVKVTDFGILAATLPPRVLDSQRLSNRIGYFAPEQIAGEATSAATDVFVLGVIAYELVTGHRVFRGESPRKIADAILGGPPPEPALPRPIVRVLQRCLARSPFERFPDARALADALDAALRVAPVPGTRKDIGAQVKAIIDRLGEINEGNASGMLALNMNTAPMMNDVGNAPAVPIAPVTIHPREPHRGPADTDVSPTISPSQLASMAASAQIPKIPPKARPMSAAAPPPSSNQNDGLGGGTILGIPAAKKAGPQVAIPSIKPLGKMVTPQARPPAPPTADSSEDEPEIEVRASTSTQTATSSIIEEEEERDLRDSQTAMELGADAETIMRTDSHGVPGGPGRAPAPTTPFPVKESFESTTGEMSREKLDQLNRLASGEAMAPARDAVDAMLDSLEIPDDATTSPAPKMSSATILAPAPPTPRAPASAPMAAAMPPPGPLPMPASAPPSSATILAPAPPPSPGAAPPPAKTPTTPPYGMAAQRGPQPPTVGPLKAPPSVTFSERGNTGGYRPAPPDAYPTDSFPRTNSIMSAGYTPGSLGGAYPGAEEDGVGTFSPMQLVTNVRLTPLPDDLDAKPEPEAPEAAAEPATSAAAGTAAPKRKSRWPWVAFSVLLLGGLGAGGYFVYLNYFQDQGEGAPVANGPGSGSAAIAKTGSGSAAIAKTGSGSAGSGSAAIAKTGSGSAGSAVVAVGSGSGSGSATVAVTAPIDAGAAAIAPADATAVATAPVDAGKVAAAPVDAGAGPGSGTPAVAITPTGASDSLQIASTPPGAHVYINGADQGQTPVKLPGSGDKHNVSLVLAGYELYTAQVDGKGKFEIALKAVTPMGGEAGIKVIKCKDKDRYYVFVDGKPTGMTCPTERINTTVGPHTVEVYDAVTESRQKWDIKVTDTRLSFRVRIDEK